MILPDFLCIGVQKAGTTSLFHILKQHSQIFLPEQKELHFFDSDNFLRGLSFYAENFSQLNNGQICGEITPNYIYEKNCANRIFSSLGGEIKLIIMLRNPADRAFSHYKMRVGRGFETHSFQEAIKQEIIELKKNSYSLRHKYLDRGFYDVQIEKYLRYFDIKNMFFLIFEDDFLKNREGTMKNLFEFLNVDKNENISVNVKSTPGTDFISPKTNLIVNSNNFINKIAKKLIVSKKLRTNVKYFINKANQKSIIQKSELEEIRPFLINNVYKNSILNLEKIINTDLSVWLKI